MIITGYSEQRQRLIFKMMVRLSAFNILLLLGRLLCVQFQLEQGMAMAQFTNLELRFGFLFLAWNLFLAWIPYLLGRLLHSWLILRLPPIFHWIWVGIWLLFFPNAPYIITDLIHLKPYPFVPFWYDQITFFSFAMTGLLLGFLSLIEIHRFFQMRLSKGWTMTLLVGILAAGSFGIYMGRFLRWNSWDMATRPLAVLENIMDILAQPILHANTLGIAVLLFAFLAVGYWAFLTLVFSFNTK